MTRKLQRYAHTDRDNSSGRYQKSHPCDACGKPVGTNYYTDEEVCGSSDGPGFLLCERVRCMAARDLPVEARRSLYTKGREKARTKARSS